MNKSYFFVSATLAALILLLVTILLLLLVGIRFSTKTIDGYGRVSYYGRKNEGTVYLKGTTAAYDKAKKTLVFENGDTYTGEMKYYLPNGKGVYTYRDGDRYEGGFENGKFHGIGRYTFRNGDVYEGDFVQGEMQGSGKLTLGSSSGETVIEGYFSAWNYSDRVSYYTKDGTYYEGGYHNGLPHGEGIARFVNGDSYRGSFTDGVFSGKGAYTFADGSVYEGVFENGKPHGFGRFTYYENGVETSVIGDFYYGVYLGKSES